MIVRGTFSAQDDVMAVGGRERNSAEPLRTIVQFQQRDAGPLSTPSPPVPLPLATGRIYAAELATDSERYSGDVWVSRAVGDLGYRRFQRALAFRFAGVAPFNPKERDGSPFELAIGSLEPLSEPKSARADTTFVDRAYDIFCEGVRAANPSEAVRRSLADAPVAPSRIVAVGKAALAMLSAAREGLPDVPSLVVTNTENTGRAGYRSVGMSVRAPDPGVTLPPHVRVLAAGHPVPDAAGETAAREVEAFVGDAGEGETVLVLVSGGASAMLAAPVEGVALADKIAVTELLLASGAPIDVINAVRRALSRLKGGGLARAIHPARTVALLLSDVPRDDIAAIASGPTVPAGTPRERARDALAVLDRYALRERVPPAVRARLEGDAAREHPPEPVPVVENRLVGGNGVSLDAMARRCERDGLPHRVVSRWLDGDVADAATALHRAALDAPEGDVALLAGGETTVVLRGDGRGGRNQELALRFALLAEAEPIPRPWAMLSGGTDGRDGPTDAAGGLVDAGTIPRARAAGIDVEAALARNDSGPVLWQAEGLLVTGPTGTNVADLQVVVLGPRDGARGITAP